ncbi:MAG: glycosyltransferase family 2 protein, partial [Tannerellaceae bacterium]|nr:glycosyltransferase family 2 protein [Tannerellaceae bacterium]
IILNPDIEFRPEIISIILNFMEAHKDVGQLLPKVVYPTGKIQYLCKMLPTPLDLICKRFLPQNLMDKRMAKFQLKFTGYDQIMNVPYLSGCFMFFRVSALKQVGLFDERFLCIRKILI